MKIYADNLMRAQKMIQKEIEHKLSCYKNFKFLDASDLSKKFGRQHLCNVGRCVEDHSYCTWYRGFNYISDSLVKDIYKIYCEKICETAKHCGYLTFNDAIDLLRNKIEKNEQQIIAGDLTLFKKCFMPYINKEEVPCASMLLFHESEKSKNKIFTNEFTDVTCYIQKEPLVSITEFGEDYVTLCFESSIYTEIKKPAIYFEIIEKQKME